MAAVLAFAKAGVRRRLGPLLGLAAALALGIGASVASFEAAWRTEHAYPDYLRRANVGDLVVNPGMDFDRVEEIIASTPGVKSYTSDVLLTAGPDPGNGATEADTSQDPTQTRVSTGGRYVRQDRPVVRKGRMVRGGNEAFVNTEMAKALSLDVGDTVPMAFAKSTFVGDDASQALEFVGREPVRVVGIGVFADEVLSDGLYPRHRMLLSPDVGGRFDCTMGRQPAHDDPRSLDEIKAGISARQCSSSNRYFSIKAAGGEGGGAKLAAAISARLDEENAQLPPALREANLGYSVIPTFTADERERVQRSLDPAVRALQIFGLAAGVSTLVVALLGASRIARRDEDVVRTWRELGAGREQRTLGIALPLAGAAALGLAGAVAVGWLGSGFGPVGSARALEGGGKLGLSLVVVSVVIGAAGLALLAGLFLVGWGVARVRVEEAPVAASRASRAVARAGNPALMLGTRAAFGGTGGRALLAASAAAVAAVIATAVFSASLAALISRPHEFGWPYDVAAAVNFGYGHTTDRAAVEKTLSRPEVARWGLAASSTLTIEGRTLPYVAARPGFQDMRLPVVKGALPTTDDQIALGTKTADRLGLDVGDKTTVKTFYGEREATVRGLVVLPPIGPFQSDRSSLGTGVLLSAPFFDATVADAARAQGGEPDQLADVEAGFVAIDLRPGVDKRRFVDAISPELASWNSEGTTPFVYPEPVRPPTVANVADMRAVPTVLAGVLALAMAVALVLAIAVAARGRRRELAVFRALGAVGRQVRATLRWQAVTVVVVGLVVGLPLGIAAGRLAYIGFASSIGVRPDAVVPLGWTAVLVLSTIAIGLLAAVGPGRRASRVAATQVLRTD